MSSNFSCEAFTLYEKAADFRMIQSSCENVLSYENIEGRSRLPTRHLRWTNEMHEIPRFSPTEKVSAMFNCNNLEKEVGWAARNRSTSVTWRILLTNVSSLVSSANSCPHMFSTKTYRTRLRPMSFVAMLSKLSLFFVSP